MTNLKRARASRLDETMNDYKPFAEPGSCSRSICETVNGSHQFTIKGYSLAKGMGAGRYIMSDTFNVGGYDWAIYFYPDGKNPEDNSMHVSVFIALARAACGVISVFFRRTSLENSEYIKDDCLVMNCTVGVVKTRFEEAKQCVSVPPSDMGQDFKFLLESEVGCDLVFQVGNESFKAHKLILAARSPVFRAQFFGLVGDPTTDKLVVEDIEPLIFKAMLLYVYTDKLPDVYEVMGLTSMCSYTVMVQHLLAAADLYNLDRLKVLCESKLCEDINTDTVATTLALAEQHHCPQLKAICLKFIANTANLGEVMQSESFMHLKESCPSMLLELLETFASVDENSKQLSRKRSGSSVYGQDLPDGAAAAESTNPNGRRMRRRT
ncbi:BTB/POZ and MATH domain-containing protein [Quillaja saponaria]|uniref:BTB/POZ and MATH domain-containing protein n=1 Tax=Quillaja saponaria TaxID=32244 RepID=A0AAD7LND4_QUISA|nr:BTB/POZ and MATH domain-containing protein [Quillaja saponaria]